MNLSSRNLIVLFLLLPILVLAQEETTTEIPNEYPKRSYTTASISNATPIAIDGNINEEAWDAVEWTTDYVEFEPDNGTAPSEQTKMKIVYDDKNLYVAFICYESDLSNIERRLGRRDDFPGDWVEINIDSYGDDRTGFSFTISASGVKGDEFISNNGNFDSSWNPIWYVKTGTIAEGWTAEMRIPLSQLRFGAEEEQVWGLQSTRRYFSNEERSTWQQLPPNPPGWVSAFGELRGIKGLKPQKQLEIQPYTVAQLDTYEEVPGNPFLDGSDARLTGGLDAKIGITNDLTLDVTINPDFGQVDADPGAIALDGFEIFFQERRPFFVENKNIFDYNISGNSDNLFFSRRIGRSPQGSAVGPNTLFIDQPDNTTILGAAKFSGKTQNGWSLGVLESVTSKEFADVINQDGSEGETLVEPLTNYFVGRAQKDFNDNNSFVGGIVTSTIRDLEDNVTFLHKNATSWGLDFRHNWKERTYYLEGNLVTSHVTGSKEAIEQTQRSIVHLFQRTDASHISVDPTKTSLTGTGGQLGFGKSGAGDWRYNAGASWRSPELELNDIGFLRRADDIFQYANITRLFNKPTDWYRRANFRLSQTSNFDFEGNYNRMQYELNGFVNLKNNWFVEGGAAHKPRIYINSFLRGGPRWRYSEENFGFLFAGTDQRKKFSTVAGYVHSQAKQANFGLRRYELRFRYQPLNALSLSLDTRFEISPNKTQYVSQQDFNGTTRYITGEIDQETISATLRVNYTINPNLTIQYYGQPFISRGRYSNFNFVTNPVAKDLDERVRLYNEQQISFNEGSYFIDEDTDGANDYQFGNPNFAFVQFRSNLVVRWEYIPGSEIFLVWSQGITGLGEAENDFNTIIDNQIFDQQPQNTFLIKATYRFVL
ncbi:MAG: carbohydrate binding family 9 domain-containing protein [Flavobacteriales bacterium]|uniref:DUF5916 domain-containing protein n=1 Tax=Candidatus Ulvibacter alkanivorans TaxID=2267620 RepID=UPI000DF38EFB|nr:DUF5916 domain-containing protein [Candidatus Ulvibacter alkanivorans]MCH2490348.1 carbohydrate binding family 9 domain-containing protein [Flavobacteriales bacterium]